MGRPSGGASDRTGDIRNELLAGLGEPGCKLTNIDLGAYTAAAQQKIVGNCFILRLTDQCPQRTTRAGLTRNGGSYNMSLSSQGMALAVLAISITIKRTKHKRAGYHGTHSKILFQQVLRSQTFNLVFEMQKSYRQAKSDGEYFHSFESGYPLISEYMQFMDDEANTLGIDTRGKTNSRWLKRFTIKAKNSSVTIQLLSKDPTPGSWLWEPEKGLLCLAPRGQGGVVLRASVRTDLIAQPFVLGLPDT